MYLFFRENLRQTCSLVIVFCVHSPENFLLCIKLRGEGLALRQVCF